MEDKFTNIKERILQIPENKGVSKEKFFESIGMSYGNFKGKSKETPINSNAIADILTIYPDINPNWLIKGEGKMLLKEDISTIALNEPIVACEKAKSVLNQIPYYDVDVFGSAVETFNDQTVNPSFYLKIPGFNDCDFACNIYGLSMSPVYDPGDVIICKRMSGSIVLFGEVYLIITAELRTVKRIMPDTDHSKYLLSSFNPDYPPVSISRADILQLYLVKGKIHQNNL
jgi:phage repressor protein C with HTH and peptisase S24 domain